MWATGRTIGHRFRSWLLTHSEEIESLLDALLAFVHADLAGLRDRFLAFVGEPMLEAIDDVASRAFGAVDLSERLAESGVLPMFGFPTKVRYLFHTKPKSVFPWPPSGVVDRDLTIAVSEFAPGGEVVKDKGLHTAVGLASWHPKGTQIEIDSDPLGERQLVSLCKSCLHISPAETSLTSCPVCNDVAPFFRDVLVSQPSGFRTDFRPRDFEGSFESAARATPARLFPDEETLTATSIENLQARAGRGRVYVLNDNRGDDFRFAPAKGRRFEGLFSVDVAERRPDLSLPDLDMEAIVRVALGAVQVTDVLLLGYASVPVGFDLDPLGPEELRPGRRGAWYSLGFLLREAAARLLDVQSQEMRVGLRTGRTPSAVDAEIFLADSLENGAGYATYLGREEMLSRLLAQTEEVLIGLAVEKHSSDCDSACYDCLKDYYNMPYHPLLDWRLGRDMFRLLTGGIPSPAEWFESEQALARSLATEFSFHFDVFGDGVAGVFDEALMLVVHPLESIGIDHMSERVAAATADAESRGFSTGDGGNLLLAHSFELLRSPGAAFGRLVGM